MRTNLISFKFFLVFILLFYSNISVSSQSRDISLSIQPSIAVPIGPVVDGDLQLFSLGGGCSIRGDFIPDFTPYLFSRVSMDLDYLPLNGADKGFTLISSGLSIGWVYSPTSRLVFKVGGGGGWYYGISEISNFSNLFFEGGLDIGIRMSPSLSLGISGRYKELGTPTGPLFQGMSVQFGVTYDLGGSKKGTYIKILSDIHPIFPLFYTYYDKNPAGNLVIKNPESIRYENMKVFFYAKQYMDGPRLCSQKDFLNAGEEISIPVYALFNDSIFRVTEGTKTAGEIIVEFYYLGQKRTIIEPVTVDIENRNAMTWDDDRKAASFVTAKDPLVLSFSKNTAMIVRTGGSPPISENFRTALALFQTLSIYGMGYTIDPQTPYTSLSADKLMVDFLQFPNQTLSYGAGDCDDLSVLYSALLESIGIPAALVTTPGHIFVAFELGLSLENASRFFLVDKDLIIRDEQVWFPVEVTLVKNGFLRAWREGIQEWMDAVSKNQAGFYPIREAWKQYEPVGFVEGGFAEVFPPSEQVEAGYKNELFRFYDFLVGPKIEKIREQGKSAGRSNTYISNKVGVFYAQLGMLDKAEEEFRSILRQNKHASAYSNLGNILYMNGDLKGAINQFRSALILKPDNARLLGISARILYALGEYQEADKIISKLENINPQLASHLVNELGDTKVVRASESLLISIDDWEEE